jgi:O-antigen/teichoic acid export membrane protein
MTAELAAEPAMPAAPPTAVRSSMMRSAVAILGTRAIDLPCRYGFHLLVAWKLGLIAAGAFYIVFSFLTLAAGAGRLGVDRALTREVARAIAADPHADVRPLVGRGLLIIAGLSGVSALVLGLLSSILARELFANPLLAWPILLGAVSIVPLCLSAGVAGALAGLHRVSLSQMIYSWLWPGIFCVLGIAIPLSLDRAMILLVVSMTAAAIAAFALLWWLLPRSKADAVPIRPAPLLPLGWSLFTSELVQLLTSALPALVLGAVASQAAVGAYALAWRLSLILNLLIVAIAAMATPRFVDHAVREDFEGLRRTAAHAIGIVLAVGALPLIVLAIAAPHFLALFGKGFDSGTTTLRLLLLSQLILMLTATTPELLGMTGHERAMQRANTWSIVIFVPLLYVLSVWMAADGAALATIAFAVINAGAASLLARKWLGFTPLGALISPFRSKLAGRVSPISGQ